MEIRKLGPLIILVCIIGIFITVIMQIKQFGKSINQYGIYFKIPNDFVMTTGDENISGYPARYFPVSFERGVIYGHDKNNYYRIMWIKSVFPKGIAEKEILEKYDDLEKVGNTILPIQNQKIKLVENDYQQVSTKKYWPWVSGEQHKLLEYKKVFAGKDGKPYYNWTYIWYCNNTERMFAASFESNKKNRDKDVIYFVGNIRCHK